MFKSSSYAMLICTSALKGIIYPEDIASKTGIQFLIVPPFSLFSLLKASFLLSFLLGASLYHFANSFFEE